MHKPTEAVVESDKMDKTKARSLLKSIRTKKRETSDENKKFFPEINKYDPTLTKEIPIDFCASGGSTLWSLTRTTRTIHPHR